MPADKLDRILGDYLKDVSGFVEANSYERLSLWKEDRESGVAWEESRVGYSETIAMVLDYPICISLLTAKVRNQRICFWHATSQLVHHKLIEAWFDRYFKGIRRVDAMNFCNVFAGNAAPVAHAASLEIDHAG